MIRFRVVKRTKHVVVYDRFVSPWYSPWKVEKTRWTISHAGFEILTRSKKVEGELR